MKAFKSLIDIVFSAIADITNIIIIKNEIRLCLIISNFILSLLLSFIIDLYNFMLLTPMLKIAGIYKKSCISIVHKQNNAPFKGPILIEIEEIVKPKIVPLNKIIISTIGIPIIVVPANHSINANSRFFLILSVI